MIARLWYGRVRAVKRRGIVGGGSSVDPETGS